MVRVAGLCRVSCSLRRASAFGLRHCLVVALELAHDHARNDDPCDRHNYEQDARDGEDRFPGEFPEVGLNEQYWSLHLGSIYPATLELCRLAEKMAAMNSALDIKSAHLAALLSDLGRVVVAYSGGVDSTLLAAVAHENPGPNWPAVSGGPTEPSPRTRSSAPSTPETRATGATGAKRSSSTSWVPWPM